ncbi:glycerophosphoryl diester phosphodiesterase membrane domain-containing protein [Novosphingobium sp.]|uniref:glycerophosphoryl diester phosphodiesterase membrane domain-containing protein n=1 Tax=Novosphingobium sp. TaxID=1874826 RepID=UPI002637A531|nr:glycerophosphoryl diester phosphodiesterase membrane domain-containing protein [Novosphingobium sp.]
MIMQHKVGGSEIFSDVSVLALRYVRIWGIAAGFLAALTTGLDVLLVGETEGVAIFIESIVNFFVSYRVAEMILRSESLLTTANRSYGSLFFASFLTTLGIGLGVLLLIVPGIYCMARWSMVTPLIVSEGKAASEAMAESWARTRESVWPLAGVYLVYTLGICVVIALFAITETADVLDGAASVAQNSDMIMPFVLNLAIDALGMLGMLIGIAVYRALMGNATTYNDVFS